MLEVVYNRPQHSHAWRQDKVKVQLVDDWQFFVKMHKSLSNKRNELSLEQIDDLTRIHDSFEDGETRPITDEEPVTHEAARGYAW